ncbi:endosialidase chaperone [Candidatus Magnetomorum sp. HK-1]|nr:endosialidase chaperone [Candidatus Magnetomorum sp. HK-1]
MKPFRLIMNNVTIVTLIALLTFSLSFAQTYPRKISYQGSLFENDEPVNGSKTITFSIGEWQQTQNVLISDGLYSVILGSDSNPIPSNIFASGEANLVVTIDGVSLTEIKILPNVADDSEQLNGKDGAFYLDWNNMTNIPQDFSDGIDNTGVQTETDPVYSASPASNVSQENINNWNNAVSWGNHAASGYAKSSNLSSVATSGNYNELSNKPQIAYSSAIPADDFSQTEVTNIRNSKLANGTTPWNNSIPSTRITGLANVAKSGSYNDLSNRPSIPNTSNFASKDSPVFTREMTFNNSSGSEYGRIYTNSDKDMIFRAGRGYSKLRAQGDLYLRYSNSSNWKNLHCGDVNLHDYIKIYKDGSERGLIFGDGNTNYESLVIKPRGNEPQVKIWGDMYVTGSAKKPGGGSFTNSSDARLKDVKKAFTRGLKALMNIFPVQYSYKKDNPLDLPSEEVFTGVIAQNVKESIPEAVDEDKHGYLTVVNDPIIWTMLNAIKELKAENDQLRAEIESLKTSIQ